MQGADLIDLTQVSDTEAETEIETETETETEDETETDNDDEIERYLLPGKTLQVCGEKKKQSPSSSSSISQTPPPSCVSPFLNLRTPLSSLAVNSSSSFFSSSAAVSTSSSLRCSLFNPVKKKRKGDSSDFSIFSISEKISSAGTKQPDKNTISIVENPVGRMSKAVKKSASLKNSLVSQPLQSLFWARDMCTNSDTPSLTTTPSSTSLPSTSHAPFSGLSNTTSFSPYSLSLPLLSPNSRIHSSSSSLPPIPPAFSHPVLLSARTSNSLAAAAATSSAINTAASSVVDTAYSTAVRAQAQHALALARAAGSRASDHPYPSRPYDLFASHYPLLAQSFASASSSSLPSLPSLPSIPSIPSMPSTTSPFTASQQIEIIRLRQSLSICAPPHGAELLNVEPIIGMPVDARNQNGKWMEATVTQILDRAFTGVVYTGWQAEVVDSQRLSCFKKYSAFGPSTLHLGEQVIVWDQEKMRWEPSQIVQADGLQVLVSHMVNTRRQRWYHAKTDEIRRLTSADFHRARLDLKVSPHPSLAAVQQIISAGNVPSSYVPPTLSLPVDGGSEADRQTAPEAASTAPAPLVGEVEVKLGKQVLFRGLLLPRVVCELIEHWQALKLEHPTSQTIWSGFALCNTHSMSRDIGRKLFALFGTESNGNIFRENDIATVSGLLETAQSVWQLSTCDTQTCLQPHEKFYDFDPLRQDILIGGCVIFQKQLVYDAIKRLQPQQPQQLSESNKTFTANNVVLVMDVQSHQFALNLRGANPRALCVNPKTFRSLELEVRERPTDLFVCPKTYMDVDSQKQFATWIRDQALVSLFPFASTQQSLILQNTDRAHVQIAELLLRFWATSARPQILKMRIELLSCPLPLRRFQAQLAEMKERGLPQDAEIMYHGVRAHDQQKAIADIQKYGFNPKCALANVHGAGGIYCSPQAEYASKYTKFGVGKSKMQNYVFACFVLPGRICTGGQNGQPMASDQHSWKAQQMGFDIYCIEKDGVLPFALFAFD